MDGGHLLRPPLPGLMPGVRVCSRMASVETAAARPDDANSEIMYLLESPLFAKQRGAGGEFMLTPERAGAHPRVETRG